MNFLNKRGTAIMQVLFAASVIAALGLFVMKSGSLQTIMHRQVKVDDYIKDAQNELSSLLANASTCSASRDDGFSSIGSFRAGFEIDKGSKLKVQKIESSSRIGREQSVSVFFEYYLPQTKTTKTLKKTFPLIYYTSTNASGDEVENCVSFEAETLSSGQAENCEISGGIFDSGLGKCDYSLLQDTNFVTVIKETACEIIGGSLSSSLCDGINISGTIHSSHLSDSKITVSSTSKTGLVTFSCNGTQVAKGFNEDGSLLCVDLVCPKLSTSNYIAINDSGSLKCQCQRDSTEEKPSFACGDTDPLSCNDYQVNDGCGLGNLCTIKRGRFPSCPGVAACGETITNSCGEVCSVGGACDDPIVACTDTTWEPSESSTCSGETFTQTSNCGTSRSQIGTKDCSVSPPPACTKICLPGEGLCSDCTCKRACV